MDGKYIQQFKKGSLEMILLCLIAQKETYGYEILTQLNQRGGGVLGYAREGTIYPIFVPAAGAGPGKDPPGTGRRQRGSKKYYSLTDKGRETLEELAAFWREYAACVDGFLQRWKEESP